MKYLTVLAVIGVFVGVAAVIAQTEPVQPRPVYPSGGYYPGGYPTYYKSSTAAEGYMRGLGDVVRSQGQANLDNSAAAINYSIARRSEIENQKQWTSTYFSMRETNRQARAAERGPRPTMEDLVRYAQAGKPKPLSPSELDTVTGKISWPMLLQSREHADGCAELQKIFADRATKGAIGPEEYMKVREVTDAMMADLNEQIKDVPPSQYVIAKRFLQSLAYEAGRPTG